MGPPSHLSLHAILCLTVFMFSDFIMLVALHKHKPKKLRQKIVFALEGGGDVETNFLLNQLTCHNVFGDARPNLFIL